MIGRPSGVTRRLSNGLYRSGYSPDHGCCTIVIAYGLVIDGTYSIPVSGSYAAPAQLAPPRKPGMTTAPRSDGGKNTGP